MASRADGYTVPVMFEHGNRTVLVLLDVCCGQGITTPWDTVHVSKAETCVMGVGTGIHGLECGSQPTCQTAAGLSCMMRAMIPGRTAYTFVCMWFSMPKRISTSSGYV